MDALSDFWRSCLTTRQGLRVESTITRGSERVGMLEVKMPKRVIFVDDLPRNTMRKVDKNVLRTAYAGLYQKR